ncbi:MAG TPA: cytochrome c biogenesis protein CcsA [Spirochaetota bacterium]|nr:cytochrome c biogenesis protein CcsA [Spirochaetota bacterium]HOD13405.1 cytochrome c biogenesis protein CcsA [Spirochaetota bacterium]HPG50292.1 cytochrome c biogenesis protein CcsA [Spirochaetota bacterium]HPN12518.1 cytochrome c biogenesis protein CcsA [Spirochaetota bacterium]
METGVNWGALCIIVSLIFSLAALASTVLLAAGREQFAVPSRYLSVTASAGIFLAAALLFFYLISSDFRFLYVYGNSSHDLSLAYRIAAFWAGKEGSFLLWLMFLNGFVYIVTHRKTGDTAIITSVLLLTQVCILVLLIIESPFKYIWSAYPESINPGQYPADGAGLNPLLKDPWMVIHPPVLFLGYASASVPFAYAIAALVKKEYRSWIDEAYPWLLFSMLTLGIGIFLGGYWAYSVLGWGGYWGWDPVENSSLIPWLVAIALVHGCIVQRRQGSLARTNLVLGLLYFITVFYSTWLTRSGVLSDFSVHSFAASDIATYLLAFFLIFTAGSAALFITRFSSISGTLLNTALFDWKTMTVYGIMVLSIYSLIILVGTSMPLLSGLFMAHPSNVTEAFYNNFSKPFGLLILLLMTLGTTLAVTGKKQLTGKENIAAGALSAALGIALNAGFTTSPFAFLFSILALFLVLRALIDLWKTRSLALLPSRLTHIGVGILVIGFITSGFHTTAAQKKLVQGKEEIIDSTGITFTGFNEAKDSSLRFTIRNGSSSRVVETAYYFDEKTQSIYKEPYIMSGLFHDVYIAPESYESGGEALTTLVIQKGEEKEIGGITVRFIGFRTEHMTSGEPTTYADLTVNGIRLSPGMKFTQADVFYLDSTIPGTDRSVSLKNIDATSKKILLHVTPGKALAIPPDTVFITVTNKRLIWLVWLGTILIAMGGGYTFGRSVRSR